MQSYVQYHGRGFWSGDFALQLWLGALVAIMRNESDRPAWLEELRREWWAASFARPSGCIDLRLDFHVTPDSIAVLLRLFHFCIEWLKLQRESGLDPEWLTDLGVNEDGFKTPVDPAPLIAVGRALRDLVADEPGPFATSPADAPRVDFNVETK